MQRRSVRQQPDQVGSAVELLVSRKKRVLFIPASIRSHIIPTLYLADLLADEYDIYYAVTTPVLADIVAQNGYTPVMNDSFRIGFGMEQNFLRSKKEKAGFWQVLRSVHRNDVYHHRKQVLDELMNRLLPDVVIIDIFSSTDFLALYEYRLRVRLLFCNPMLSTYRVGNFPVVSEGEWPQSIPVLSETEAFRMKRFIQNPGAELYRAAMRYQWRMVQQLAGLTAEHQVIQTPYTRLFANVPELLLAPLELEVSPDVRQPNGHYLGLCVQESRADTEVDPDFARQWPGILARKQAGERIIYCSFGTFYTGPDRTLLTFIENLLTVVSGLGNVQLVCSVNPLVIQTVRAWHRPSHQVHLFSRVPQLAVLQQADVFITHGGLGSIKESIYYGVPMLVYPLDPHYDQPGNALKVEHHGLGLRGVFHTERATNLQDKLQRLLNDGSFADKIRQFKRETEVISTRQIIRNLLTNTHHEADAR
ncbi:glycosyltransferase [Rudanella lutea]|uniref:glycosyltransferase n=1 Tax=Rudanella lutea TaxID=451374 RepID=UPI001B7FC852|nr:glycosyltransferase [Rudanella lutea]